MKITMIAQDSLSIDHGGPRVQILRTKKELESLGIEVQLFSRWEPFSAGENHLAHLFTARYSTYQVAQTLWNLRMPFVTSPIFFSRHSPALVKTIVTGESLLRKLNGALFTNYGCTRQICKWSRRVLPNTKDEAQLIERGFSIPPSKIRVVPNGVDKRFANGDPSLFWKKYGIKNFILNVGHIGPARKNVLNLIRALSTIDHPAVLIGRVSKDDMGHRCFEEALRNKNILIIDGIDHESRMLASAYAACDTFVLPSLFETPGIAALEAGLAGAKIVITPYGGPKEYFGDLAIYVEPSSVESIRTGIISALEQHPNDKLSHHIRKEYLWKAVGQKTLSVYKEALELQ